MPVPDDLVARAQPAVDLCDALGIAYTVEVRVFPRDPRETRLVNALRRAGVGADDLTSLTDEQILAIPEVGRNGLARIRALTPA